jgi:hypothetical protein
LKPTIKTTIETLPQPNGIGVEIFRLGLGHRAFARRHTRQEKTPAVSCRGFVRDLSDDPDQKLR